MVFFRRWLILTTCFAAAIVATAQRDSSAPRISLLTCGPGEELYSTWGHTGIRVIDSVTGKDIVFNYGTFDDSDPLFYLKFTRGIMLYSVTPFSFPQFMEEYQQEHRSVIEQVLALESERRRQLATALWRNSEEENRYYPYHFYADNCTTRARDIISSVFDTTLHFPDVRPSPAVTYRQLIHEYMRNDSQAWNRFGIDILLGMHLDEKMNTRQAMFLPDYLMKGFAGATVRGAPLVEKTNRLLPERPIFGKSFFTPATIFLFVLALALLLPLLPFRAPRLAMAADGLLLLITGLLGLLIATLWIVRVDNVCRNNLNILWALPSHVIVAFIIPRKKQWLKIYWLVNTILYTVLIVCWPLLPQEMNSTALLLVIILFLRTGSRYHQLARS